MKKQLAVIGLAGLVGVACGGSGGEEAEVETEVTVHVGEVTRQTLRAWVTAYGTVEPAPPGERPGAGTDVSPATPGVVTAVACREGQTVRKGQLLFQLDPRAADAAAQKARDAVESARTTLERQRALMGVEGTSQRRLVEAEQALKAAQDELAAAETQQALQRVEAPIAGTVTRVAVRVGDGVDLATTLAQVVDLDRLVASAGVPSAELGPLRVGQAAEVRGEGATAPLTGSVVSIRPEVDVGTGTALVRIGLPAGSGLRPGQLVTVRVATEERSDRLSVPVESVVRNAEGQAVIALVKGDRAVQTPVKVGLREAGRVEVEAEGLEEGLVVVTEGAYGLPAETKVRVSSP